MISGVIWYEGVTDPDLHRGCLTTRRLPGASPGTWRVPLSRTAVLARGPRLRRASERVRVSWDPRRSDLIYFGTTAFIELEPLEAAAETLEVRSEAADGGFALVAREPGAKELVLEEGIHQILLTGAGIRRHAVISPNMGLTDCDGAFQIARLPPGRYRITAWHGAKGQQDAEADVTAGRVSELELTFTDQPPEAAPHKLTQN